MINEEQRRVNDMLRQACVSGDLEEVKYYLTNPRLLFHANIHEINPLRHACQFGYLDIVQYLLTSPELKEHACASNEEEIFLYSAVYNKQLSVVKYLLESPDLTIKPNIHVDNDMIFNDCAKNKNYDMIHYFIFDFNIEKTDAISKHLERNPDNKISSLFEMRELNKNLTESLEFNNDHKPKIKI